MRAFRSTLTAALWGAGVALLSCSDGADPVVPTSLVLSHTTIQFTSVGASQTVFATVRDQRANIMTGAIVTWASTAPSVVMVTQQGVVTAVGPGNAQVSATAGSVVATLDVIVTGPPATLVIHGGNGQTGSAGNLLGAPVSVRITDAMSQPVPNVSVAFTVTSGGGGISGPPAVTNAQGIAEIGWVLGSTLGTQTLRAAVSGLPPVTFTATAVAGQASQVVILAGNNQTVPPGATVPVAPSVKVIDGVGNPISGVAVTFAATVGGGSVSGGSTSTNAQGIAVVGSWTLGPSSGFNALAATVAGSGISGNPATFTANAGSASAYTIDIRFLGSDGSAAVGLSPTAQQVAAFAAAVNRWSAIITTDLEDVPINVPSGSCGGSARPAINETVDDLLIFVILEPIDGPFGVLGTAGPCFIRGSGDPAQPGDLPLIGLMRFDTADLDRLTSDGRLESVIVHEMGHVVGIGTLWGLFELVTDPSRPNMAGADTYFTGTNAIAAFDLIGGATYSGGNKVPVENSAVQGSADTHWRESVLGVELMTPLINSGSNPLSLLSVRSLQDLGYAVDVSQAEAFNIFAAFREGPLAASPPELLMNDIVRGPIGVIGKSGREVRTIIPPGPEQ
jgi:hypothetical protein